MSKNIVSKHVHHSYTTERSVLLSCKRESENPSGILELSEAASPQADLHCNGGVLLIDLHVHSQHSDGTSPPDLIDLASRSGLSCISITDHDTVSGLQSAVQYSANSDVRLITGLEISVDEPRAHILGYGIDHDDPRLCGALERIAESRDNRNPRIVQRLQQLGYGVTMEDVEAQSEGGIIGRVHIARALADRGYFADIDAVFDNLIGRGRPAYVDRERLTAKEGIALIRDAGGVAVLAHPGLLSEDPAEITQIVSSLMECGLQGIEAMYTEHSRELTRFLIDLATAKNLVWTGGTDFHGENKPEIRLGIGRGDIVVPDEVAERLQSAIDRGREASGHA